jgi:hypothetical protein
VTQAIDSEIKDFEDAVQYYSAVAGRRGLNAQPQPGRLPAGK